MNNTSNHALFEKYKPSPSEFLMAKTAAKIDALELMLIEILSEGSQEKRLFLGTKNDADIAKDTEAYLAFLCPLQSELGGGDKSH
jgi:hypothetical protein